VELVREKDKLITKDYLNRFLPPVDTIGRDSIETTSVYQNWRYCRIAFEIQTKLKCKKIYISLTSNPAPYFTYFRRVDPNIQPSVVNGHF
ncbi:8970_t:CDS:1, partial [Racocetra persica]